MTPEEMMLSLNDEGLKRGSEYHEQPLFLLSEPCTRVLTFSFLGARTGLTQQGKWLLVRELREDD